jgi:hypothetical protein
MEDNARDLQAAETRIKELEEALATADTDSAVKGAARDSGPHGYRIVGHRHLQGS